MEEISHVTMSTPRREKKLGVAKSDDQDSPPRRPDAKSTVQIKMPSDSEIEDFFTAAEKDLQKRFTDKYEHLASAPPLSLRFPKLMELDVSFSGIIST